MDFEKHLLVDGSNVVQAWPELRSLAKREREAARQRLSLALRTLHDAERVRVSLVFDGRGAELAIERPAGTATFVHAFSPSGMTADDVIEQWVGRSREPGQCVVATDDRAERETIEALGAAGISAAELARWVERVAGRQREGLVRRRRANDRDWRRPG
jgi:predicted RNA-binding protein with PIN domain